MNHRKTLMTSAYHRHEDKIQSMSKSGDRYDESAKNYICWDAKTPVKLRMGNKYPENMPPILSQTMLRNTVCEYPDVIAVSFKRDNEVVKWTYKVRLCRSSFKYSIVFYHKRKRIRIIK